MNVLGEFIRYALVHIRSVNYYIKKSDRQNPVDGVSISFTSIPSRIADTRPTINSLLDQSVRPENIFIHIPGDPETTELPDFIKNNSAIKINWIKNDLGPATKLIPALEMVKQDDLIIVLDDDQVYPKRLVETYQKYSKELPDVAFCQVGWRVPKSFNHEDRVQKWGAKFRLTGQESPIKEMEEIEVLQGASSYAVKPKFFDAEVSDYEAAPKEARFVDDIWFSGLLAKKNVKKFVVPGLFKYCRLTNSKIASGTGLVKTANKSHDNNNSLYKYFEDYWKLYD